MKQTRTKSIDWMTIEAAYRVGTESVRGIARRHGVSDTIVLRRARQRGWTRTLTAPNSIGAERDASIRAIWLSGARTFAISTLDGHAVLELRGADGTATHYLVSQSDLDQLGVQLRRDALLIAAGGARN